MQGNHKQQQKTISNQKPKIRVLSCGKIGQNRVMNIEQMKQRLRQERQIVKLRADYDYGMNQYLKPKNNDYSYLNKKSFNMKQDRQTKNSEKIMPSNNIFKDQFKNNQSLRINNHISNPQQDSPTKQKNQTMHFQRNQDNNLFINFENKFIVYLLDLVKNGRIKQFLIALKNNVKNLYLIGKIQNAYITIEEQYKYLNELKKDFNRRDQVFQPHEDKWNIFQEKNAVIYQILQTINEQLQIKTNLIHQNDNKGSCQNIKKSIKQIIEKIRSNKSNNSLLERIKTQYEFRLKQKQKDLYLKQEQIKKKMQQKQAIFQKYSNLQQSFQQTIKKQKQRTIQQYQIKLKQLRVLNQSNIDKLAQSEQFLKNLQQLNVSQQKKYQQNINFLNSQNKELKLSIQKLTTQFSVQKSKFDYNVHSDIQNLRKQNQNQIKALDYQNTKLKEVINSKNLQINSILSQNQNNCNKYEVSLALLKKQNQDLKIQQKSNLLKLKQLCINKNQQMQSLKNQLSKVVNQINQYQQIVIQNEQKLILKK